MPIKPLRSYRATIIPPGTDASDVETLADKRLLPTIRVKAPCCQTAERAAKNVTGHPVLRAERVEEVAA